MKRKSEAGFTLVEVVIAMALLAAIVVPVCSSLLLSLRMNAKAEAVLQARLAVSSAVETLMAEGISEESPAYDELGGSDRFDNVKVETKQDVEAAYYADGTVPTYYIVEVTDNDDLVTVTTCIRAAEPTPIGGGAE